MKSLSEKDANLLSPLTLAFLGDAVYEVLVRERLVLANNMPPGKLHDLKVALVCASFQAKAADALFESFTEKEKSIFKRGRNAGGNTIPKNVSTSDYRHATGLECLFGYLHITANTERITALFNEIWSMGYSEPHAQLCNNE